MDTAVSVPAVKGEFGHLRFYVAFLVLAALLCLLLWYTNKRTGWLAAKMVAQVAPPAAAGANAPAPTPVQTI